MAPGPVSPLGFPWAAGEPRALRREGFPSRGWGGPSAPLPRAPPAARSRHPAQRRRRGGCERGGRRRQRQWGKAAAGGRQSPSAWRGSWGGRGESSESSGGRGQAGHGGLAGHGGGSGSSPAAPPVRGLPPPPCGKMAAATAGRGAGWAHGLPGAPQRGPAVLGTGKGWPKGCEWHEEPEEAG